MADTAKLDELIMQLDNMTLSEERRRPKFKMPELARIRRQKHRDSPVVDLIVEVLNNTGRYETVASYHGHELKKARERLAEETKIVQAERARGRLRISTRYDMGATHGVVYVVEVAKVVTNNYDMFYYPVQEFSNLESAQEFVAGYGE